MAISHWLATRVAKGWNKGMHQQQQRRQETGAEQRGHGMVATGAEQQEGHGRQQEGYMEQDWMCSRR